MDVSAICSVWNAHHDGLDLAVQLNSLLLELFSLAKPYFDEKNFLIAELGGRVVGFLHFGHFGNADHTDLDVTRLGIHAFCVCPGAEENAVAAALLDRFIATIAPGVTECFFKPLLPNCAFYLGLGPGDSMVGATSSETRTCKWLSSNGFVPTTPTCQWELDLGRFQPPVDRLQIQIRRASQVNRQVDEPILPWWQACVLGHTEPTTFQLTHRTEKRVLNEILCWSIAPELHRTRDSVVWLWPPNLSDDPLAPEQLLFLLAESLRELQSERVDVVRTVSLASENANTAIFRRLGFTPVENGVVFRRGMGEAGQVLQNQKQPQA